MRRATVGRRLATADPEGDGPCEKVVSGCVQVHIENKGSVDTAPRSWRRQVSSPGVLGAETHAAR